MKFKLRLFKIILSAIGVYNLNGQPFCASCGYRISICKCNK